MKKIGIFGGTFDPIHIGHLITARSVKEIRNLSKIIFVPANTSPLKQNVETVSSSHRLEMTKLAISKFDEFSISDFEITNNGISYTIDTIKYFKEKYGDIELIIGYDNFLVFDKWYKWKEITELVDVIVLKRFYEKKIAPKVSSNNFIFVESPTIQINSTNIRERISKNLPINLLVPDEVQNYIRDNKLYSKNEI